MAGNSASGGSVMGYYQDVDEAYYIDELVYEEERERLHYQRQEQASFKRAVAAEVKRQLKTLTPTGVASQQDQKPEKRKQPNSGKRVIVSCKCCDKPFKARVSDRKRGWGRFCSKSCSAFWKTHRRKWVA
ncbi:hypothetical protein [Pseudovibrio sp. SPO723]|uniref:hypothetical protein n=1 Tax=Nesiotobacter zosterae TaxID=392721 RepID=UPI0029C2CAE9|nr:hypothetical protein [Pseudovibrio sp. SPO723]MDX5592540.1 hypothetical protein [Pseudovibrio sp. SPO723]